MTTRVQPFYAEPEFERFLPFIKATAAWDKRAGNSPRFDLKSGAPFAVVTEALAFKGECVACGRPMHPFRSRAAEAKRGKSKENVYLAVCCPSTERAGCNKGRRASDAYQALWSLVRAVGDKQEPLL